MTTIATDAYVMSLNNKTTICLNTMSGEREMGSYEKKLQVCKTILRQKYITKITETEVYYISRSRKTKLSNKLDSGNWKRQLDLLFSMGCGKLSRK